MYMSNLSEEIIKCGLRADKPFAARKFSLFTLEVMLIPRPDFKCTLRKVFFNTMKKQFKKSLHKHQ